MRITLSVIAGPHMGQEFAFGRHDTFLVGRSKHAHFQLPVKDKYFSRIHFMVEVNPPQCRLVDMGSHNGTYVNGQKVLAADLQHGDQIRAGHTILKLSVLAERGDEDASASASSIDRSNPYAAREVPGYELVRELGRGGMGVVFLAVRLADKSQVALKLVVPSAPGSPAQIERFLREASVLTELEHPHIVRFHDLGETQGYFYFVMDYIAGPDAGTALKNDGPFAIKRAARIACQLLDAVEYAHARQLVHRDIKPANVLLAEKEGKERARLADFGLARIYQASQLSGLTMTDDVGGSVAFMSPEQITNYQDVEPEADQYAAAATLYTLLTGQHVYDFPKEPHRRFSVILQQQPVPIQTRRADIPAELAAVIHKALSRNPGQRFASAASFRKAIIKAVKE